MITFLAPAWRCLDAVAASRKMPVDSTTTATPSSFHGSAAGSFWAQRRTSRPCALGERRAGRQNVVDQQDVAARDRGRCPECPADIRRALGGGEVALRPGRTPAREPTRPNGQGEPLRDALGEKGRLI